MSTDYDKIRANLEQRGYEGAELDRAAETTEAKIVGVRIGADVMRERIRELEAQRDELRAVLTTILKGFEDGVFVRDVTGDGASDWGVKLLPFVVALSRAQVALARSEP